MAFQIRGLQFRLVCEIIPEQDNNGIPKEYMPQCRYQNSSNLPLNRYGQGPFCQFKIPADYYGKSGVYVILVNSSPKYVGECEDLGIRWNMGYGHIAPRNCFKRGRETNCRINNLILETFKKGNEILLLFRETKDKHKIENCLIEELHPEWNLLTRKTSKTDTKRTSLRLEKERLLKYGKLEKYLRNSQRFAEILTYKQIESIIGSKLPVSAYKYREWWANKGHSHAKAWASAGWKVKFVELGMTVGFQKTLRKSNF